MKINDKGILEKGLKSVIYDDTNRIPPPGLLRPKLSHKPSAPDNVSPKYRCLTQTREGERCTFVDGHFSAKHSFDAPDNATPPAPSLADRWQNHCEAGLASPIDDRDAILAALRAVEAVRAFSMRNPSCVDVFDSEANCEYCDGYRDGVEAVQALLQADGK